MKLWLIRHAPVLLPAGICYGASDVLADVDAVAQSIVDLCRERIGLL